MNLKRLQKVIEHIGEGLPPGDDWMPALILESKKAVNVFGFVGDCLATFRAKDRTAQKITELIMEFKPDSACFITTAWTINFDKIKASPTLIEMFATGQLQVSQHPDRVEAVNAYCYGVQGENEGEAFMLGYVQRFQTRGPRIKKWKINEGADISAEGRFPNAIKEGFRLAKEKTK